ncbi:FtsX-like permease family protein [Carboxydichorda subterranea]|uniref:FtsX-like permease family protein n=1 Tax=Carboxydichorda subterranea TaxID=3109565 RepID=UPI0038573B63
MRAHRRPGLDCCFPNYSGGVSALALLAVTLLSAAEQARAIGMRRALGATRGRIMLEVLAKTSTMAGLGGAVAAAAARPMSRLLTPILLTPGGIFRIPPSNLHNAFTGSGARRATVALGVPKSTEAFKDGEPACYNASRPEHAFICPSGVWSWSAWGSSRCSPNCS